MIPPDGVVRFKVRVQPRASRTELAGFRDGVLRIRLQAPPVDGAANEALIAFLADELGVARRLLRIVSGSGSRNKVVEATFMRFPPLTGSGRGPNDRHMILLVGENTALLEGIAQALANSSQRVAVAHSLEEAMDLQSRDQTVLTVVERSLVADGDTRRDFLRNVLSGGGAVVTYREAGDTSRALPALLARHVLADLVLPLERNRLVALAEHVASRAKVVGRQSDVTRPDASAS